MKDREIFEEPLLVGGACRDDPDPLATLLAPLDLTTFLQDYWHRQMLAVPGTSDRFQNLIGWDDINAILSHQRLEASRFELVQRGKRIDAERFTFRRREGRVLDAGAVNALLAHGATLVLSFLDEAHPAVRCLAEAMEERLSAHVNVNLYASWKADQGFALHWDTHDVFVLQVRGRKRWRIFRPTHEHPVRTSRGDVPPPDGQPHWEGVLEDGMLLYLPRGWWHEATPLDEPSLHLTLAVTPPIGRDFLTWLAEQLDAHHVVRKDLPVLEGPEALARAFDELRSCLLSEWDSGAPARFLSARGGDRAALPRFDLPALTGAPAEGLGPETLVRLASVRRLDIFPAPDRKGIVARNGSQHWPCHEALGPALAALRSGTARSYEELCGLLPDPDREPELRKQLLLLAHAGAVTLITRR